MDSTNPSSRKICPVCNVSITADDQVNFSNGRPGTRARLYARVCQYAQKPGCINQSSELIGELTREDSFETGEDLVVAMAIANPAGATE